MDRSKEEVRGDDNQQQKQNQVQKQGPKGKSCKGYLYYSSSLKSHNRNPRCIGIPSTLHKVPNYVVGQSEVEDSKDGRILLDFYYACAGYSVYRNLQDVSINEQGTKTELPVCVGLELLVDRKVANADAAPAHARAPVPAPAHNREDSWNDDRGVISFITIFLILGISFAEDVRDLPRHPVHNKPTHSSGDDFLSRFTRNANLVASGVARNLRRVGNHVKESLDDILYPYRKRPK